jgi:hypothetical protein
MSIGARTVINDEKREKITPLFTMDFNREDNGQCPSVLKNFVGMGL